MCGLAGVVSNIRITDTMTGKMINISEMLKKRGGNSSGFWKNKNRNVMFAHQRLTFLDSTELGHQPMHFNGLSIVFNGEIYNYKEIREELMKWGYSFKSESDTEVILKAYDKWSEKAVEKFNGEFSIAIWDEKEQELYLVRDRYGIRPMYYHMDKNSFCFASDLKALYKNLDKSKLNREAINYYYSMQAVVPTPLCLFEGYKKLQPGHFAVIKYTTANPQIKISRYYDIIIKQKINLSEEECIAICKKEILKAIERRISGESKSVIWLSGGLDSSLIAAMCVKDLGINPEFYSIGFQNGNYEEGNEFKFSRKVVEQYPANYQELLIDEKEIENSLEDSIIDSYEPMMSNDYIGHYILGKYTKSNHLKKVLSGVGGDEIWHGYEWHKQGCLKEENQYQFIYDDFVEYSEKELKEILTTDYYVSGCMEKFVDCYTNNTKKANFEDVVKFDLNYVMVEDPIKRADVAGMSHGVEVRTPFLDHEVVGLSMMLSNELKNKNGQGKYVLKKIAEEYFDKDFIYRKKGYFTVPDIKYTKGRIGDFCRSIIDSNECRNRGIITKKSIDKLINSQVEITPLGGNLLWQSAILEYWLQTCK